MSGHEGLGDARAAVNGNGEDGITGESVGGRMLDETTHVDVVLDETNMIAVRDEDRQAAWRSCGGVCVCVDLCTRSSQRSPS